MTFLGRVKRNAHRAKMRAGVELTGVRNVVTVRGFARRHGAIYKTGAVNLAKAKRAASRLPAGRKAQVMRQLNVYGRVRTANRRSRRR